MNACRMHFALGWIVIGSLAWTPTLRAQTASTDRVWLQPRRPTQIQSEWFPRAIETRSGKIVQLDSRQLRFLVQGDEAESQFAAHRVVWFEPATRSEKETAALKLFRDGKYREAVVPLVDVLSERPPVWRQQWLAMLASYAAWQSSQSAIAVKLVADLDKRPLAPITIAFLPVAWRSGPQHPDHLREARQRLSDSSAAVRLVAASWLISSSPDRGSAAAALKQLSLDQQRPMIARLAEAVLWRAAPPPQVQQSADSWQQKLDALPMVLQVGPTITLIEKLRSAGLDEPANRLDLSLTITPPFPHPELRDRANSQ